MANVKSKGNVIDPLELIKEYGADSLRLMLISAASPEETLNFPKIVICNRNFITKFGVQIIF